MSNSEEQQFVVDRRLSVGDAIAIFGFVVFICVWTGGWLFIFANSNENTFKDLSFWEGVVLFVLVAGPGLWAGKRIEKISG